MNAPAPWFIYIILCKDRSLYTGISLDPKKRFVEHQSGHGGAYTRSHPPVRIVYTEQIESRSAALRREAEIKHWGRLKKMKTLGITVI